MRSIASSVTIVVVVNNLQEWANQKAPDGDLDAFNEGYDKSQQHVDDGGSAGCFFIY